MIEMVINGNTSIPTKRIDQRGAEARGWDSTPFDSGAATIGLRQLRTSDMELLAWAATGPRLVATQGLEFDSGHRDDTRWTVMWAIPAPEEAASEMIPFHKSNRGLAILKIGYVADVWAHGGATNPDTGEACLDMPRLARDLHSMGIKAGEQPTMTPFQRLCAAGAQRYLLKELTQRNAQSLQALAKAGHGTALPASTPQGREKPLRPATIARAAGVSQTTVTNWLTSQAT